MVAGALELVDDEDGDKERDAPVVAVVAVAPQLGSSLKSSEILIRSGARASDGDGQDC